MALMSQLKVEKIIRSLAIATNTFETSVTFLE